MLSILNASVVFHRSVSWLRDCVIPLGEVYKGVNSVLTPSFIIRYPVNPRDCKSKTIINHGYRFFHIGSNLEINHYKKRADCVKIV